MKCDVAIRCIFDMNQLDINVFKTLQEVGEARADEIADILNRERSTVYRSLQKLTACGICQKITKTIKKGGYYHIYQTQSPQSVRTQAEQCLDEWYKKMKQTIQLLDSY